jgi:GNAT superfamily N-acetyltransferase
MPPPPDDVRFFLRRLGTASKDEVSDADLEVLKWLAEIVAPERVHVVTRRDLQLLLKAGVGIAVARGFTTEQIIGVARLVTDLPFSHTARIEGLAVLPEFRDHDVGRSLAVTLMQWAKEQGIIMLGATVRRDQMDVNDLLFGLRFRDDPRINIVLNPQEIDSSEIGRSEIGPRDG